MNHSEEKSACPICYDFFDSDQHTAVGLKLCQHIVCMECYNKIITSSNKKCPFCLITLEDQEEDAKQLDQREKQTFAQESHFHMINHDFFHQDLQILKQNLNKVSFELSKDQGRQQGRNRMYENRWMIFEQLKLEVQNLEQVITNQEKMDPENVFNQVIFIISGQQYKILNYNQILLEVGKGNWNSSKLVEFSNCIDFIAADDLDEEQQGEDEDLYITQFIVNNKRNRKKKKN